MKYLISIIFLSLLSTTAVQADWKYENIQDEMGRGTVKVATTKSTNTVNFGFPYEGKQRATLFLRSHPTKGDSVFLSIEKGQLLCSNYDGCNVAFRFDNTEAMDFKAAGAKSQDPTMLFFTSIPSALIHAIGNSKKIKIEVNAYQEGAVVFNFHTKDLKFTSEIGKVTNNYNLKNTKNKKTTEHSHSNRKHSHPLPPQGKKHKHGNGAIGK